MQEELTFAEQLAAWLPMLLFLGVFFLFARWSHKTYNKHVEKVNKTNQEIVDTNREMIAELKEIKQVLKGQN